MKVNLMSFRAARTAARAAPGAPVASPVPAAPGRCPEAAVPALALAEVVGGRSCSSLARSRSAQVTAGRCGCCICCCIALSLLGSRTRLLVPCETGVAPLPPRGHGQESLPTRPQDSPPLGGGTLD